MITYDVVVHYRDGTVVDVHCDQYALSGVARWQHKSGIKLAPEKSPLDGVVFMRVMAWAEVQRAAKTKVVFEVWDETVAEVEEGDGGPVPVDPTLLATSVG